MVKFLSQLRAHGERVVDGPGLRRIVPQTEFEGQVLAAVLHAGVDASGIGLEIFSVARGEGCGGAVGYLLDAEDSLLFVVG